jgi:PAS domain S-box-containing protein
MKKGVQSKKGLLLKLGDLKMRLEEAEETLQAIRKGEVDALVVSGPQGDQIYTLEGAEQPYRVFLESMNEGAFTLTPEGTILYSNRHFAEMLGLSLEKVINSSIYDYIAPEDKEMFKNVFIEGKERAGTREIYLKKGPEYSLPVNLSVSALKAEDKVVLCAVATDLTEQKQNEKVIRESQRQCKFLSDQLLVAQENERQRIAKDLHDSIGQALSAIKYRVENAIGLFGKSEKEEMILHLRTIIPYIQQSLDEVRRIERDLRPPVLDDFGVLVGIDYFIREFQTTYSKMKFEKRIDVKEEEIPDSLKVVIYRIMQEACNNVVKHTDADLIQIALGKSGGMIELVIRDNGGGFDPQKALSLNPRAGLGLASMRERAEYSGGVFSLETAKGTGTVIRAKWPLGE